MVEASEIDKYNFEMHSWRNPMNWGRNIETLISRKVAGNGMPYEINIYGSKTLNVIFTEQNVSFDGSFEIEDYSEFTKKKQKEVVSENVEEVINESQSL